MVDDRKDEKVSPSEKKVSRRFGSQQRTKGLNNLFAHYARLNEKEIGEEGSRELPMYHTESMV